MNMDWQKILDVEIHALSAIKKIATATNDYYVYILWKMYADPPVPFYIGKGHLQRIVKHGMDSDSDINKYKTRILNKHKELGIECGYTLLDFFADEECAFQAEMELIALIGRHDLNQGPLANKTDGGDGARGVIAPKGGDSHSAKPVFANGRRFSCLKDAADHFKLEPGAIAGRIKNGWDGYFYESEGQRPQTKNILGRYTKEVVVEGVKFSSASEASRRLGLDTRMISKRISWGWEGYYYTDVGQLPRRTVWTNRTDKIPVIIRGQSYETISAAAQATGESFKIISTRCLSPNYPDYVRLDGRQVQKLSAPKVGQPVVINSVEYRSISEAAKSLGLSDGAVIYRCRSTVWTEWKFSDPSRQDSVSFTPGFSSTPVAVFVDGIRYESQSEAAAAHRITIGSVKSRCRSMSYPGWTCEGVNKVPAKDGKPSFIGIEIDGNRYRSVSAASKSLGLDRSTIMRRLKSQAWPSYKVL